MSTLPPLFRTTFAVAPFLAAFFFPYQLTLALGFLAGLVFPPLALAAGILLDLLYYSGGWPFATTAGLFLAASAEAVRRCVLARIM